MMEPLRNAAKVSFAIIAMASLVGKLFVSVMGHRLVIFSLQYSLTTILITTKIILI